MALYMDENSEKRDSYWWYALGHDSIWDAINARDLWVETFEVIRDRDGLRLATNVMSIERAYQIMSASLYEGGDPAYIQFGGWAERYDYKQYPAPPPPPPLPF